MTPHDIARIRAIDVWWFLLWAEREAKPVVACRSTVTGEYMDQAETARAVMHRMRLSIGSKREREKSRQWLDDRGLVGEDWQAPYSKAQVKKLYHNHRALERAVRGTA